MMIFFVKLLSSVRKAIAGRKYPHQLAWAVAFGLLLGIVPHGNIVALAILVLILTLRVNHAMVGLTAVAASFAAGYLDPYSHQVGDYLLSHPRIHDYAVAAWQLPMAPWTDLNNTVVLGSLLIGSAALVPAFAITYPIFRYLAPSVDVSAEFGNKSSNVASRQRRPVHAGPDHPVVVVDQGHHGVTGDHDAIERETTKTIESVASNEDPDFQEIEDGSIVRSDSGVSAVKDEDTKRHGDGEHVAVETRIDVIRMHDFRNVENNDANGSSGQMDTDDQPMDEALNYLLRQLRDSQQRKAA